MRTAIRVLLAIAAISAVSCGGGGGGAPAPELVQISSGNQQTIARAVAFAIMDAISAPEVFTGTTTTRKSVATATKVSLGGPALPGAGTLALHALQLTRASTSRPTFDAMRRLAVSSVNEACAIDGSFTVTVDDRDNSGTLSAGDTITLTFLQCRDFVDVVVNGSMFMALSSTPTPQSMIFTLTFQELSTIAGTSSSAINGTASATFNETTLANGSTISLSLRIEAAGMTIRINQPGYFDTLTYDAGYESTSAAFIPSDSGLVGNVTASLNGTFGSTLLGGKLALTTAAPENFVKFDTESFPHQGRVSAKGRINSALRVTALNAAQVRLELDANGDGAFEASQDVGWSTLLP